MKVLIVEPYYTGSHAAWADGVTRHSSHDIRLLTMQGRYWKWRMHGGSVTLANRFRRLDYLPDLIIATDMLDLADFLALTRDLSHGIPTALYFHENQLTYPWSPEDRDIVNKRDRHYAFINYISAMVSDRVFFNSRFHLDSFLGALPDFLKHFPDHNELSSVESIRGRSAVLPPGVELSRFDQYRPSGLETSSLCQKSSRGEPPVILWNHRWEHDKNPDHFFSVLYALSSRGHDFRLVVLGEKFGNLPPEFENARTRLDSRILKFGYAESFQEYATWLWRSDILPVTSLQDFFGMSIVEAMYCGCLPCLPRRLAYPDLFGESVSDRCFYQGNDELFSLLESILSSREPFDPGPLRETASRYDWPAVIGRYDEIVEEMVG